MMDSASSLQDNNTSSPISANRPFLSYNNFKRFSQEMLETDAAQNLECNNGNAIVSTAMLHQKGHSICRLVKRFPDGRVWLELGGHELLLSNGTKNAEIGDDGGCQQCPLTCLSPHMATCIFANSSPSSGHHHSYHHQSPAAMRSSTLEGYPERMPFGTFCRAFRALLAEELPSNGRATTMDERECAKRILQNAKVAGFRYRLGLSQILLQREVLEELERRRSQALADLFICLQANCRRHLFQRRLERVHAEEDAILTIQRNFEAWKGLRESAWWKLFTQIRPLVPISVSDEKERRWREQMAQLELELDELRSEMSRAQLELESTRKAKEMAERWGHEMDGKCREMHTQLEHLRGQKEAAEEKALISAPFSNDWDSDEKTMDLKRQLAEAFEREQSAQQKAHKAFEQLREAQTELQELGAKQERTERRQKTAEEELANLRTELEKTVQQKEQIERQQFELTLKDNRRRNELQRELEAKEAELEELRSQNQRRVRALEAQLEEATAENSTLMKQQKNGWQRRSQSSASLTGSLLDLAQNSSLANANRALKRKLAKALALLQSSQAQLARDRESAFEKQSQLRNLRQYLDETEAAKLSAQRAQYAAETELAHVRAQLDTTQSARLAAEQKLLLAMREKNAATALAQEQDDQLQEALKRERSLAEQLGMEQIQQRTQLEQIVQLERELRAFKLSKPHSERGVGEFTGQHLVERQQLEMAELKLRDCSAKLELEQAQRRRIESLLNKHHDELESLQQQLQEVRAAKEKEMDAQKKLRRENNGLQEQLIDSKRREAELGAKQRQMRQQCVKLEEELRSSMADLKLANKRLEILQNAFNAECHQQQSMANGAGSVGGTAFSSVCGGSELGDLEEMLLEEEEELLERGGSTEAGGCCADSLEFDGANSDTVEGSSSGHEKCEFIYSIFE